MFLKINYFKALMKKAWSGVGLTVGNDGEGIYLLGGYWSIYLDSEWITKKAKAAIIELTGFIPAAGHAVAFWKSEDNQTEERELLRKDTINQIRHISRQSTKIQESASGIMEGEWPSCRIQTQWKQS